MSIKVQYNSVTNKVSYDDDVAQKKVNIFDDTPGDCVKCTSGIHHAGHGHETPRYLKVVISGHVNCGCEEILGGDSQNVTATLVNGTYILPQYRQAPADADACYYLTFFAAGGTALRYTTNDCTGDTSSSKVIDKKLISISPAAAAPDFDCFLAFYGEGNSWKAWNFATWSPDDGYCIQPAAIEDFDTRACNAAANRPARIDSGSIEITELPPWTT